ncbi:carboxylesterase/lipase family protein [Enterococcus avium]|uniref:carboxylesterase/lipase family protein n=1 Tax=Enterococcus avium TaxID=33945 RepID=UPI00159D998B|nr:carboxylesterase family protein [Enterococcus avium]NVN75636.1 carboxylesterase family protein [Enterococcus avium]
MTSPIIETTKGKVQGININGVDKFLGIPFAKPPIGERRFFPPVETDTWEGVLDASSFKTSPMQLPGSSEGAMYPPEKRTAPSEDCLYLNVYAPENASGKNLPVMVWLYGGHYMNGSSTSAGCEGSNFAKNQKVIVVTFNYRVGIFGFMAHPKLKKTDQKATNAGLEDMLATLKWIRENISSFGGNPNNVTLFGVSAGSSAINVLLTCPAAEGLFHAAITQSGSPFNHDEWDINEAQEQTRCLNYLAKIGVSEDELFCVSAEKLLSDPEAYEASEFCPYVDGRLVPARLEESFLAGKIHDIPIILGCTADEAFILLGEREKVTKERFEKTVATKYPDHKVAIYNKYGAYLDQSPAYALGRFRSDNTIANMRYFASCLVEFRTSPTYFYIFQKVTPGKEPYYYGAYHASENAYHFQNLNSEFINYGESDVRVSNTMAKYWANFAACHDPNSKALPEWKKFTPQTNQIMYIDDPCDCVPLKTKALTEELQKILEERTEKSVRRAESRI